jgi:hypothetical protein
MSEHAHTEETRIEALLDGEWRIAHEHHSVPAFS